jgi:outer membrane lipoprotein SlyB
MFSDPVYRNGVVQLHIWAEGPGAVTLEQFKIQLEAALRRLDTSHAPVSGNPTTTTPPAAPLPPSAPTTNVVTQTPSAAATSTMTSPHPHIQTRSTSNVDTASTSSATVPLNSTSEAQQSQRADYVRMQKEREQKQRDERERIKQQIKNDREERRRREELRNHPQIQTVDGAGSTSATSPVPKSRDIRVQVRTFDGTTLRQTFSPSANITSDIRPWIDSTSSQSVPYNLKLILTPLPNRNIEAAEEEQSLVDLGITKSCTLVMMPVKGYVESYTGSTAGGIVGSAVSGGYSLVTGTAGAVFGGVKSLLGWTGQSGAAENPTTSAAESNQEDSEPSTQSVRVRTLADQRIEAAKKKDQQFYNGNQLNFQPRKDEDKED